MVAQPPSPPDAIVELAGGTRREVRGRAAVGTDRERLWQRWRELDQRLDGFAARRPRETAVVVLEPALPVHESKAKDVADAVAILGQRPLR
jgi:hypothetical protein